MKEIHLTHELNIIRAEEKGFEVTSPAPRQEWLEIARSDPNTLVSQTPEWIDCICKSGFYQDASRLYYLSNGRKLVLPMVRRFGFLPHLSILESPPNSWGIGGILAPGGVTSQDISIVLNDLVSQPYLYASIRPNPLDAFRWAASSLDGMVKIPRLAHVLNLEGGFEHVWSKRFESTTRENVRHAERAGLLVESDTTGKLAPVFYQLFQDSIHQWAAQQKESVFQARLRKHAWDPLEKLQKITQQLGENCRIWIAFLNGEPAAGIIVLQGTNAYYARGAMIKELAGPTHANYLLHSLAIQEACHSGCHYYQMGESGQSISLARFKERFGAQAYRYAEYRIERLPVTEVNYSARELFNKLIGFKDM